jgi:hypothetical protein
VDKWKSYSKPGVGLQSQEQKYHRFLGYEAQEKRWKKKKWPDGIIVGKIDYLRLFKESVAVFGLAPMTRSKSKAVKPSLFTRMRSQPKEERGKREEGRGKRKEERGKRNECHKGHFSPRGLSIKSKSGRRGPRLLQSRFSISLFNRSRVPDAFHARPSSPPAPPLQSRLTCRWRCAIWGLCSPELGSTVSCRTKALPNWASCSAFIK